MQGDWCIHGGTIVNEGKLLRADIGIQGDRIVAIGSLEPRQYRRQLDATGLHILPGLIDTQVHFREPGLEHKEDIESGTRAALCGGVTTIFEMPNTNPITDSPERLQDKLNRANGRAWANYSFFFGATTENADRLDEYEMLPGSPGIKMFMGSSTGTLLVADDENARRVLQHGSHPMSVHSEDEPRLRERMANHEPQDHAREHPHIRDAETARLCTERLIALSEETGRAVHILHISTKDELPLLAEAKKKGLKVTCEVTPQHLFFAAPECYDSLGTFAQMNPPIRSQDHRDAIRQALRDGLFDVIGSDHAPHTIQEKAKPYPKSPSGMPGVQTLVPVMLNFVNEGLLTIDTFVQLGAHNPAELFGIKERGYIREGYFADLTLVDMTTKHQVEENWIESKCGWSPYSGVELKGWPVHVFINGDLEVEGGCLVGKPSGRQIEFNWK